MFSPYCLWNSAWDVPGVALISLVVYSTSLRQNPWVYSLAIGGSTNRKNSFNLVSMEGCPTPACGCLAGHLVFSVEPIRQQAIMDSCARCKTPVHICFAVVGLIHPVFRVHAVVFTSETRFFVVVGRIVLLIGVGNALFRRSTIHFTRSKYLIAR